MWLCNMCPCTHWKTTVHTYDFERSSGASWLGRPVAAASGQRWTFPADWGNNVVIVMLYDNQWEFQDPKMEVLYHMAIEIMW